MKTHHKGQGSLSLDSKTKNWKGIFIDSLTYGNNWEAQFMAYLFYTTKAQGGPATGPVSNFFMGLARTSLMELVKLACQGPEFHWTGFL